MLERKRGQIHLIFCHTVCLSTHTHTHSMSGYWLMKWPTPTALAGEFPPGDANLFRSVKVLEAKDFLKCIYFLIKIASEETWKI